MKLKYYLRTLGLAMMVTTLLLGAASPEGGAPMSDGEIRERAAQLGMIDADSLMLSQLRQDPAEDGESKEKDPAGQNPVDGEEPGEGDTAGQNPEGEGNSGEGDAAGQNPEGEGEPGGGDTAGQNPGEEGNSGEGDAAGQNPEGEGEPGGGDAAGQNPGEEENPGGGDPAEQEPAEGGEPGEEDSAAQNPEAGGEPVESVIITIKSGDTSVSVSRRLAEAGLVADAEEYDSYLCRGGYDKALSVGTYEIPIGSSEEEIAKIITKRR